MAIPEICTPAPIFFEFFIVPCVSEDQTPFTPLTKSAVPNVEIVPSANNFALLWFSKRVFEDSFESVSFLTSELEVFPKRISFSFPSVMLLETLYPPEVSCVIERPTALLFLLESAFAAIGFKERTFRESSAFKLCELLNVFFSSFNSMLLA